MKNTTVPDLTDAKVIGAFLAKISKSTNCWTWTGARQASGHGMFRINGLRVYAHRASHIIFKGEIPDGYSVDHICHNPTCVNPSHLRSVTHKQNMENRSGAHKNSKSGIRGVTWNKKCGKWEVRVRHCGKGHYGGVYASTAEAESAAIALRNQLFTCNSADIPA